MTNKNDTIERIPSIHGRRIQQLRKDAKRYKKKLGISLQEALNLTVKEQGFANTWQRLMTRSVELFGKISGTPYEPPLAKSTVFMGQDGSNMSRIATDQWARALTKEREVIDVFIDAHGDTLTYATVASKLAMNTGFNTLRLFTTHRTDGTLLSNLFADEPKTIRCLVNTLFEKTDEQLAAFAYLHGDENIPAHVIERVEESKEVGLLMWLEQFAGDKGIALNRALGFCSSTLFLLPPLNQAEINHRYMLSDILKLCIESVYYDNRAPLPMRITLTGLNGLEPISSELMTTLMTDPNIQLIMQTEPNAMSEWQDLAIKLAEQTYISRIIDAVDVPTSIKCTTERLKRLENCCDKTPVLMYRKGELVDVDIAIACDPACLVDKIDPPTHRDGQSIADTHS